MLIALRIRRSLAQEAEDRFFARLYYRKKQGVKGKQYFGSHGGLARRGYFHGVRGWDHSWKRRKAGIRGI